MPGPYAHLTLLYELRSSGRFEKIFPAASGAAAALEQYFSYCLLGAVSPDYPNLAPADSNASGWADAMHCTRACEMLASGIRHVREADGPTRNKQMAWLLGYASHVAADVTIHPIVQAKVGAYATNQRHHRICEMHQDSFIYRRMSLGEIGESDEYAQAVLRCGNAYDRTALDYEIVTLWEDMLEEVHPQLFAALPPDCSAWHRNFVATVDQCRDSQVRLFPLAGRISERVGLMYPAYKNVGRQFVANQVVPSEKPYHIDYDDVFDHAADAVAEVWNRVAQAVCSPGSDHTPQFGNWNLDTGHDGQGRLVFWE
ncbi:MAG TPA: zinc dependent phospholipase C family protein [Desulfuromonadales bacterium]|nr:zinc dependent phospholipase C family protein [Desulfuromonadales bacterium]